MTNEEIFNTMQDLVAEQFAIEPEEVSMESSFEEDLGADSLDMAYVMMEVDKLLEIHIDENDGWDKNSTLYETCSGIVRTLGETDRR